MKKVYSKRDGSEMAIVKVEDLYGSFDAMLFSKTFALNKDKLLVDNIIKIKGKLSINDRGVCVRVENISQIEDDTTTTESTVVKEEKKAVPRLYLMYDLTDQELSKEIYSLLRSYPGESPVIVKCSKNHYTLPPPCTGGFCCSDSFAPRKCGLPPACRKDRPG